MVGDPGWAKQKEEKKTADSTAINRCMGSASRVLAEHAA